jgi:hypothetical protein
VGIFFINISLHTQPDALVLHAAARKKPDRILPHKLDKLAHFEAKKLLEKSLGQNTAARE